MCNNEGLVERGFLGFFWGGGGNLKKKKKKFFFLGGFEKDKNVFYNVN
jgi:hypothetical protein